MKFKRSYAATIAFAAMCLVGSMVGVSMADTTTAHTDNVAICQAAQGTGNTLTEAQQTWAENCVAVFDEGKRLLDIPPYPNASNTGVPAGTTLTDYEGSCIITTDNVIIDSKTITCPDGVSIQATNVTISKSKVNGVIRLDEDNSAMDDWSLVITDTEVDAGSIQQAALCCGDVVATRVNLHGGQTGAQCEELSDHCIITDSYLHGQVLPDDAHWHLGGFLSDGTMGSTNCDDDLCIQLIHNTVVCDHEVNSLDEGCSGDINLIPNFATASGILIKNNFLGANKDLAYCTFGGEKSTSDFPHGDHISYIDNVFERANTTAAGSTSICGGYGPWTDFNPEGVGNTWTNNKYDNGTPVTLS